MTTCLSLTWESRSQSKCLDKGFYFREKSYVSILNHLWWDEMGFLEIEQKVPMKYSLFSNFIRLPLNQLTVWYFLLGVMPIYCFVNAYFVLSDFILLKPCYSLPKGMVIYTWGKSQFPQYSVS